MQYLPRRNEDTDLLGGFAAFASHLSAVQHQVEANESKFTKTHEIDELADGMNAPEHVWDEIAPGIEQAERDAEEEGVIEERHLDVNDLQEENSAPQQPKPQTSIHARYQTVAEKGGMKPTEYRDIFFNLCLPRNCKV